MGEAWAAAGQEAVESSKVPLSELGIHPAENEGVVAGVGHGQPVEHEPDVMGVEPVVLHCQEIEDHLCVFKWEREREWKKVRYAMDMLDKEGWA